MSSPHLTPDASHLGVHHRTPDARAQVVQLDPAVAVGAAIRAARRNADAATRAAIATTLAEFAAAGCSASALVLAWFDRDTTICRDATSLLSRAVGGVDGC